MQSPSATAAEMHRRATFPAHATFPAQTSAANDSTSGVRAQLRAWLEIGRVSNLPTVWSNALAGAVLAGAELSPLSLSLALLAFSLFYVAGMMQNDLLDVRHDAIRSPRRPLPSGRLDALQVRRVMTVVVVAAFLLLALARFTGVMPATSSSLQWLTGAGMLWIMITLYNHHHRGNPYGPLLMAGCRVLLLLTAAATLAGSINSVVLAAAVAMLAYLVGLTWIAKQEPRGSITDQWPLMYLALPLLAGISIVPATPRILLPMLALSLLIGVAAQRVRRGQPGDIGQAVGLLIAGLSVVDALWLMLAGASQLALLALMLAALTLLGQRVIAGT